MINFKDCSFDQFKCASNECIPHELKCDGETDCKDGISDEVDCISKFYFLGKSDSKVDLIFKSI